MKKLYIFLFIVFFMTINCTAADNVHDQKGCHIGLNIGVGTQFIPDSQYSPDYHCGLFAGVNITGFIIKNYLCLQLELNYLDVQSYATLNYHNIIKFSDHWLQHVFLVKSYIVTDENAVFRPFLAAGPSVEYTADKFKVALATVVGMDYILDNGNSINIQIRAELNILERDRSTLYNSFILAAGYRI
jgi:hypothetical protein